MQDDVIRLSGAHEELDRYMPVNAMLYSVSRMM